MIYKIATKKLLIEIERGISKYGFILNKKDQSFRREVDGFIQIFDIIFTKKLEGIYVQPTIRLKSKQIEAIYHRVAKKDPEYFDGTKTLGNDLFKISKFFEKGIQEDTDEKKSYIIEDENDIAILSKVLIDKFIIFGLRYLEENSSISQIDSLLNMNPREISIHNWLYPLRACIAIIAAKLNKNPKYEELVKIYSEELKEAVYPYNEEFTTLVNQVL